MNINYYKKYEPIFGSWYIKDFLGEGSFGQVYKIERSDLSGTFQAALKAITIPKTQGEIKSIIADGMTIKDVSLYYRGVAEDIANEFVMLSKLKGNSNIVSYEDHKIIEHPNKIGWDILIRMELLTPLQNYIMRNGFAKRDAIKLGIDLCKAIELCQKYNIIHRDIKPENIFISPSGDYKLGDFGIARTIEETANIMSKKGTYTYMAPEIYRGEEEYDSTVDMYSLGIVLYKLLNNNRTPFEPEYPASIKHNDKEEALMKRISGTKIPRPKNAEGRLGEIVLKACEYKPKDRYSSVMQMRAELKSILYDENEVEIIFPEGDEVIIKPTAEGSVTEVPPGLYNPPDSPTEEDLGSKEKTNWKKWIIAAGSIIAAAVIAVLLLLPHNPEISGIDSTIEFEKGQTYELEYTVTPKRFADEQVVFSTEDTSIASVSDNEITGERAGETKLKATIEDYSEEYKVVVKPATVTAIKGVKSSIKIAKGSSKTVNPDIEPEAAEDRKINYSIKDESIATVSSKGKITGKKKGKTTLIIEVGNMQKEVKITVYKKKKTVVETAPANNYVAPETYRHEYWE